MNNYNPHQNARPPFLHPNPNYPPIYAPSYEVRNQFIYHPPDPYYNQPLTNVVPATYVLDYPTAPITYREEYQPQPDYQQPVIPRVVERHLETRHYTETSFVAPNNRDLQQKESNKDLAPTSTNQQKQDHLDNRKPQIAAKLGDLKSAIELNKRTQDMLAKLGWFNSNPIQPNKDEINLKIGLTNDATEYENKVYNFESARNLDREKADPVINADKKTLIKQTPVDPLYKGPSGDRNVKKVPEIFDQDFENLPKASVRKDIPLSLSRMISDKPQMGDRGISELYPKSGVENRNLGVINSRNLTTDKKIDDLDNLYDDPLSKELFIGDVSFKKKTSDFYNRFNDDGGNKEPHKTSMDDYDERDFSTNKKSERFDRAFDHPSPQLREVRDRNIPDRHFDRYYPGNPVGREISSRNDSKEKSLERFEKILLDRYDPPSDVVSGHGSEKPGSIYSEKPGSIYSEKPGSIYLEKPGSIYSEKPGPVYSEKLESIYSKKPGSIYSERKSSYERRDRRSKDIDDRTSKERFDRFYFEDPADIYSKRLADKKMPERFERSYPQLPSDRNEFRRFQESKKEPRRAEEQLGRDYGDGITGKEGRRSPLSRIDPTDSIFEESTLQKINEIYNLIKREEEMKKRMEMDRTAQEENRRFSDSRTMDEKSIKEKEFTAHLNMLLESIGYDNLSNSLQNPLEKEQLNRENDKFKDNEKGSTFKRERERNHQLELERENDKKRERDVSTGLVIDYSHGPNESITRTVNYESDRHLNKLNKSAISMMAPKPNLGHLLAINLSGNKQEEKLPTKTIVNQEAFANPSNFEDIKIKVFIDDVSKDKKDHTDIWKEAVNAALSPVGQPEKKVVRRIELAKRSRSSSRDDAKERHSIHKPNRNKDDSPIKAKYKSDKRFKNKTRDISRSKSKEHLRFNKNLGKDRLKRYKRSSSRESNSISLNKKMSNIKGKFRADSVFRQNKNFGKYNNQQNNMNQSNKFIKNKFWKNNLGTKFNQQNFSPPIKRSESPEVKHKKIEPIINKELKSLDSKLLTLQEDLQRLKSRKKDLEEKKYLKPAIKNKISLRINEQIKDTEKDIDKLKNEIKSEKLIADSDQKSKMQDLFIMEESQTPIMQTKSDPKSSKTVIQPKPSRFEPLTKGFNALNPRICTINRLAKEAESKDNKPDAKLKLKKMEFDYFDGGSHWCSLCNMIAETFEDYCLHLHSERHCQLSEVKKFRTPRFVPPKNKSLEQAIVLPMKGVEFLIPAKSLYCDLCKELLYDKEAAFQHSISESHNKKYLDYTAENHDYEKQLQLQKDLKIPFAQSCSKWLLDSTDDIGMKSEPDNPVANKSDDKKEIVLSKENIQHKAKHLCTSKGNTQVNDSSSSSKLPFIGKFPKYKSKNKEDKTESDISGIVIAAGCATADQALLDSIELPKISTSSSTLTSVSNVALNNAAVKSKVDNEHKSETGHVKVERITGVVSKKKKVPTATLR